MRAGPEPILPAADVRRARTFYESLGLTAGYNDDRYEILRRGDRDDLAPAANRTSCYWRVTDADQLYRFNRRKR
jgi:hypothetical protein